jgi:hypothetical protein
MTITALPLHDSDGDWHVPGDAPVAPAGRLPDGTEPGCLSRFGDDIWDLSPLARREHEPGRRINWASFPPVLRSGFKRAGWFAALDSSPGSFGNTDERRQLV